MARLMLGTTQHTPACPVMLYSRVSGRCYCGDTVKLRKDGRWTHAHSPYCRNER